jgi:hypothetical protein
VDTTGQGASFLDLCLLLAPQNVILSTTINLFKVLCHRPKSLEARCGVGVLSEIQIVNVVNLYIKKNHYPVTTSHCIN